MNAIEVNNISKRYGKVEALQNVSFSVAEGEVFARQQLQDTTLLAK